ncbi:MAG: hypothetical protein K2X93_29075 [Candidatus Obscuribacterales bacterium]|nr:hypothetical protein [Candidatus Obscuribacterales bacterium]
MDKSESRQIKRVRTKRIKKIVNTLKRTTKNDGDAIQKLVNLHQRHGKLFRCRCGNTQLPKQLRVRITKCGVCRRNWRITAGTIFHRVRKLFPYVIAIHLKQSGISFVADELVSVTDVSYSTASLIIKKLSMVIFGEMNDEFQEFSSVSFLPVYSRRSRATPSYSHPRAEEGEFWQEGSGEIDDDDDGVDETHDDASEEVSEVSSVAASLPADEAFVYDQISDERISFNTLLDRTNLKSDKLSLLLINLQLDFQLIDHLDGELYRRRAVIEEKPKPKQKVHEQLAAIESFKDYVKSIHQGISRKYAQLYAADCWCAMDQDRWDNDALFIACIRSEPKSRRDIVDFVSPVTIKLPPRKVRSRLSSS